MTGLRYLIMVNGAATTIVEALMLGLLIIGLVRLICRGARDWLREIAKRRNRVRVKALPHHRRAQIIEQGTLTIHAPRRDFVSDWERRLNMVWRGRDD